MFGWNFNLNATPYNKKFLSDKQVCFIKFNMDRLTATDIAKVIGMDRGTLRRKMSELGLKKIIPIKYPCNFNYFSLISIKTAYLSGYISADAYLRKLGDEIAFCSSGRDLEYLVRIKKELEYKGPMDVKHIGFNEDGSCRLRCKFRIGRAQKLINDLNKNFNIFADGNKSFTLIPPPKNLSLDQNLSYIAGNFDGDGHVAFHKYRHSTGTRESACMGFCGTKEMMVWIKLIFDENFPSNYKRSSTVVQHGSIFGYRVSGKRAIKIFIKFLDLDLPFRLHRKWNIIKNYINKVYGKELYVIEDFNLIKIPKLAYKETYKLWI